MKKKWRVISCVLSIALFIQCLDLTGIGFTFGQIVHAEEQAADIRVNFQPKGSAVPVGYLPDNGEVYGSRNGYTYGWNKGHEDMTAVRNTNPDSRLDTLCQIHSAGIWEMKLDNGAYDVTVSVGDAVYGSVNTINVEGVKYWDNLSLKANQLLQKTNTINITDGKLTIDNGSAGDKLTRINYITIAARSKVESPDQVPPTAPQNLRANGISNNEINLAWDAAADNSKVAGYILYRDGKQLSTVAENVYGLKDTGLSALTTYTYEVSAFDTSNNISPRSGALRVTTAAEPQKGIGLKGEYFNGIDLVDMKLVRTDAAVNFDWEAGAPGEGLDPDSFSVRWTGKVIPRFSETYTFQTETHGGVRLWVNNKLLIDDWNAHNMTVKSGTIALTAGANYDVRMEYIETSGSASAKLLWSSTSQLMEIIPQSQLNPPFIPGVPANISTTSTSTTATVRWNVVEGATGYDIEVDGVIQDNGTSTTYIHTGLITNSQHTYRVRAKVPGVVGFWSEMQPVTTKISVPTNINAVVNENVITVSWNPVAGAEGYDIEVDGALIDNGVNTVYVHRGLMPNTQHTYRVRARNKAGTSDWSMNINKAVLPSIPTNIKTVPTSTTMTVTWDEVPGAVSYDIEVDGVIVNNGANTVYVHKDLVPISRHSYRIRAVKASGAGEWSAAAIHSTLPLPGSGTGLKGEYFDNNDFTAFQVARIDENINFDWKRKSPAPGVEGDEFSIRWTGQVEAKYSELYTFYTETHGGIRLWVDNRLLVDDWGAHNTTHRNGSIILQAGRKYDIKMEYCESNGVAKAELLWSSPSQAKEIVPQSQLYPIGVPGNLTATATEKTITVNWEPVSYAVSYEIEVDGVVIDNGTNTTYVHSDLVPGIQHTYRVRAIRDVAVGEWSNTLVKSTLLGKSASVVINGATETTVAISWEPVEGASGYDIEADGVIVNNGDHTAYMHSSLLSGTLHSYRVRARTLVMTGDWTSPVSKWTLPGKPENITANATEIDIRITWGTVRGATGYDIETDGHLVENVTNPYLYSGLLSGTEHKYRVRAKNASGLGQWSEEFVKWTLPGVPQNISLQSTETDIAVSWDMVTGALGYDVEIDGIVVDNSANTSYQHIGLLPGTEHRYRIRAKNSSGEGKWSEEQIQWTIPDIPQNLNAASTSSTIILSWDAVTGATGYDIQVYGTAVDNGSSTTYMHQGLNPNEQHAYRVRAKNSGGLGKWSPVITKTTLPVMKAGINTVPTDTSITVLWDPIAGAEVYDIEVDGVIITDITATSYQHTGLTPNTEHTYRVRPKNSNGTSDWSEFVTRRTLPATPSNLKIEAAGTEISVTWDKAVGAERYEIEADGVVVDNGAETTYIHKELKPASTHMYRVRARNADEAGNWSGYVTGTTLPGVPENIHAQASTRSITLGWDKVQGAAAYEIELDGTIAGNATVSQFTCSGLKPNTSYTIRVRAKGTGGAGPWSELMTVKTGLDDDTPAVWAITATATSTTITLRWKNIDGAARYEVSADGVILDNGLKTEFVHSSLPASTQHVYQVRAKAAAKNGSWSNQLVKSTLVGVPANILATAKSNEITLKWDTVEKAAGYDIEVDGVLIDNRESTDYTQRNLQTGSVHKFRVRAKNDDGAGDWSALIEKAAGIGVPVLTGEAYSNRIELTWDAVEGAEEYDIEADGEIIDNGASTAYTHDKLEPNTPHKYRARAKNALQTGEWSEELMINTSPELLIECQADDLFNFMTIAPRKEGKTQYIIKVEYNPEELEVVDLCAATPNLDVAVGAVPGTELTVSQFSGGKIVLTANSTTGVVNAVKFKAKINGYSKVTYVIE